MMSVPKEPLHPTWSCYECKKEEDGVGKGRRLHREAFLLQEAVSKVKDLLSSSGTVVNILAETARVEEWREQARTGVSSCSQEVKELFLKEEEKLCPGCWFADGPDKRAVNSRIITILERSLEYAKEVGSKRLQVTESIEDAASQAEGIRMYGLNRPSSRW